PGLSIGNIAPGLRDWETHESLSSLLPPQVYASRRKLKRVVALWCRASVLMPQWRMRIFYRRFLKREDRWTGLPHGENNLRLIRKGDRWARQRFRRMMKGERAPGLEADDPSNAS